MMADINLHMKSQADMTCVSNAFIDHYMKSANGEFVKIYLYLLRALSDESCDFSIAKMAEALGHTQLDIKRALTYWESQGLVSLRCDLGGEICDICMYDPRVAAPAVAAPAAASSLVTPVAASSAVSAAVSTRADVTPAVAVPMGGTPDYSTGDLESLGENRDVQEILFIAQRYLGRTLSDSDVNHLLYWYDGLSMSVDLIEHLIAHCVDQGKKSFSYMNKVAIAWAQDGVATTEDAQLRSSGYADETRAVMKSLGITGRTLTPAELEYVGRWFHEWGFSIDMVQEACTRTILATGRPQMSYADRILSGWREEGITDRGQLPASDKRRQEQYRLQSAPRKRQRNATVGFHNFSENEYDVAALESQVLRRNYQ